MGMGVHVKKGVVVEGKLSVWEYDMIWRDS